MNCPNLRKSVLEETFEDVKGLIYDCIAKFRALYGFNDEEELLSVCHIAYMKAMETYNPSQGSITSWIRLHCFGYMKNSAAKKAHFSKHRPEDEQREEDIKEETPILDTLDGMCEDAQTIALLILETPFELAQMFAKGKKETKTVLTEYLKTKGWKPRRIRKAFYDLYEHLTRNQNRD